jgi:hypothetical protein
MGMTPEAKRDFADQMERLKSLRHPGIVRCYGGGFDQRDAYLVYELVDGESLESHLNRRVRLPWESVLDYGRQLCEALKTAHDSGWVHGRLRPDKLLLTRDAATIKITDFRRKEHASNMMVAAPTAEQLAYASPESLLAGKMNEAAEVSSDLYSLGAILYHMLTGQPPFQANHPTQMKAAISDTIPAPVSTVVFDCPVWLATIVEQLLDKQPARRPFSAQALSLALKEAHRRASDGISVAQHAVSGFSPLQVKSANRDEAEKVLGRKPERTRKTNRRPPLQEQPIFLLGCLLLAILAIAWFLMPPGEGAIRARAEKLLASQEPLDWERARDDYLATLIEKFPESSNATWAQEQTDQVDMNLAERKIERGLRLGRPPETEAERLYLEAQRFERFGDVQTALEKYRSITRLMEGRTDAKPIVNLANRQSQALSAGPNAVEELRQFLDKKLHEAQKLFDQRDIQSAKAICQSIHNLYQGNKDMASAVARAQSILDAMQPGSATESLKSSND